jgi:hypothetical protein
MDQIAREFKEKGVEFHVLYTREPHAGQKTMGMDFSDKKQTSTREERVAYAREMLKDLKQYRPILIDKFGAESIQRRLGAGMPNSLIVVDREGKVALWQGWSDAAELRKKLEELTSSTAQKQPSTEGKARTVKEDLRRTSGTLERRSENSAAMDAPAPRVPAKQPEAAR